MSALQLPFHRQAFLDCVHSSGGLLILARGLGIQDILRAMLELYADPELLVLVLNLTDSLTASLTNYFQTKRNDDLTSSTLTRFHAITNESAQKRKLIYYNHGGCIALSARVLLMDLLKGTLPANLVSGVIVMDAHQLVEDGPEAFALDLLRRGNSRAFVKALSDRVEPVVAGWAKPEKLLRALKVRREEETAEEAKTPLLMLYPRYYDLVMTDLSNSDCEDTQLRVEEFRIPATNRMRHINQAITLLHDRCLKQIARAHPDILDLSNLPITDLQAMGELSSMLRRQLRPVWHCVGPRVRALISELAILHSVDEYALAYDAVTVVRFLETLRWAHEIAMQENLYGHQSSVKPKKENTSSKSIKKRKSRQEEDGEETADGMSSSIHPTLAQQIFTVDAAAMDDTTNQLTSISVTDEELISNTASWLNTDLARAMLQEAQDRLTNGKAGLPEPCPKWRALLQIIDADGNSNLAVSSNGGSTLIFCSDGLVKRQLVSILYAHCRSKRVDVVEIEGPSKSSPTIKSLPSTLPSYQAFLARQMRIYRAWHERAYQVTKACLYYSSPSSSGTDHGQKPKKKPAIIRPAIPPHLDTTQYLHCIAAQTSHLDITDDQDTVNENQSIDLDALIVDEESELFAEYGILVRTCSETRDFTSEYLSEIQPRHIVLYQPDLAMIRAIEVFHATRVSTSNHSLPLKVSMLMYADTTEESQYLITVRREKDAFATLQMSRQDLLVPKSDTAVLGSDEELEMLDFTSTSSSSSEDDQDNTNSSPIDMGQLAFFRDQTLAMNDPLLDAVRGHKRLVLNSKLNHSQPRSIIVDTRDLRSTLPYILYKRGFSLTPRTLPLGDYLITPECCVERKSLADLVSSFASGRLYTQMEGICSKFNIPMLLIEFDRDRGGAFHLADYILDGGSTFNINNTDYISSYDVRSRLVLLLLHFPLIRLIWSASPSETALIFRDLKRGHPNPPIDKDEDDKEDNTVNQDMQKGKLQIEKKKRGPSRQKKENSSFIKSSFVQFKDSFNTYQEDSSVKQEMEKEGDAADQPTCKIEKSISTSSALCTNPVAREMLLRMPGINTNNVHRFMHSFESFASFVQGTLEQFEQCFSYKGDASGDHHHNQGIKSKNMHGEVAFSSAKEQAQKLWHFINEPLRK